MSRIGKMPIIIPNTVEVKLLGGGKLSIKGPKGELSAEVPAELDVSLEGDKIRLTPRISSENSSALWGLHRSLLQNKVTGVSDGFEKQLEVVGVGFRVRQDGSTGVSLSVGFSHTVEVEAPEGINLEVMENKRIKVSGIDKALVGQVAARIRAVKPPEPYKGKGIRYVGEFVAKKSGKSAKVGGAL